MTSVRKVRRKTYQTVSCQVGGQHCNFKVSFIFDCFSHHCYIFHKKIVLVGLGAKKTLLVEEAVVWQAKRVFEAVMFQKKNLFHGEKVVLKVIS